MSLIRRAKTRDGNEQPIVDALQAVGAVVVRLDRPCDLLVGFRGTNTLIEVKQPKRVKRSDQREQADWRETWPGQVAVACTPTQALIAIGALPSGEIDAGPEAA